MATMDVDMASPVGPGPMVALGYDQGHEFRIPAYQSELDLCQLLQAMSLTKGKFKVPETDNVPHASPSANEHAASTAEDPAYHSDASASSSSSSNSSDQPHTNPPPISFTSAHASLPGCHFLQSILASLAPESPVLSPYPYPYPATDAFQTTNGAYLDTLLLHRSLLEAFPPAHLGCAATLHEIAKAVELRAWQADRDSDAEAVAALRQEAYIVVHWV